MNKIKYKANYIKQLLDLLDTIDVVVVKNERSINIPIVSAEDRHKILHFVSEVVDTPLTYQVDETTNEITIFDTRL